MSANSLTSNIQRILDTAPPEVTWRVAVTNPDGGLLVDIGACKVVKEGLSLQKLPVAVALRRSKVPLSSVISLKDHHRRDGNGILQYFPSDYELTLQRAAELMLSQSDNTATRMVVEAIGGPHRVNELLKDERLTGKLPPECLTSLTSRPNKTGRFLFGSTTAHTSAAYMRTASQDPVFGPALRRSDFWYGSRRNIDPRTARLPHPAHDALSAAVTARASNERASSTVYKALLEANYPESAIATKAGVGDGNRHEAAVIDEFTVVMLGTDHDQNLPEGSSHPAHRIHAAIGELVWGMSNQA